MGVGLVFRRYVAGFREIWFLKATGLGGILPVSKSWTSFAAASG